MTIPTYILRRIALMCVVTGALAFAYRMVREFRSTQPIAFAPRATAPARVVNTGTSKQSVEDIEKPMPSSEDALKELSAAFENKNSEASQRLNAMVVYANMNTGKNGIMHLIGVYPQTKDEKEKRYLAAAIVTADEEMKAEEYIGHCQLSDQDRDELLRIYKDVRENGLNQPKGK